MSIKLKGSTDGSVTLQAPADTSPTGTDKTLTLPTTEGSANQFVKNGSTAGSLEYSSMVEDSSGRVGIGTSSPDAFVHLRDNSPFIRFTDAVDDTHYAHIGYTDAGALIVNADPGNAKASSAIKFHVDNSECVRFTDDGHIHASTLTTDTSRFGSTPGHFLHHADSQYVLTIENSHNSSPFGVQIDFDDDNPDNNSNKFINCLDSSTTRFIVWSDGDVDNHDNSYSGISDVKLKQDITDSGSQWDDIKDLRVRKFKFKSDVAEYGDEAKTLIGVVAQELELVSPGLVKDTTDFDSDGNDLGTTTKSVRYSVLYMKAIKALQEAMERIETLEAKVAALEAAE